MLQAASSVASTQTSYDAALAEAPHDRVNAPGSPDALLAGDYQSTSGESVTELALADIVPNRFQRDRTAFLLDPDKFAVNYLRSFETIELAKTGDAEKREIIVEYTLECRAPKAHGAVYDIL